MADLPREPRFDVKKTISSSTPFQDINQFYYNEIDGLIKILSDTSINDSVRSSIRKYLTITIFAALDYYYRNAVKKLIDKNDRNVDPLFPPGSKPKLEKLIKKYATTKGYIVALTYRFVDVDEIDFVFSNLLQKNSFLDYMIKLNYVSPARFVLKGHPLPIEYDEMTKAYKLRNEIAHEIKNVKVSKSRVIALWDNYRNIMDLSQSVFLSVSDPEHQKSLDSDFQRAKRKLRSKAIYKLCSDNIMSNLYKKKYGKTIDHGTDFKDKILQDNFEQVISFMLREELIEKDGNERKLTLKGEKRFRRTTKKDISKWKREISHIVCSWIPVGGTNPIHSIISKSKNENGGKC